MVLPTAPRDLRTLISAALLLLPLCLSRPADCQPGFRYLRAGAAQDSVTRPQPGYALMGGGADLDEAFRWLCQRASGGDFLILRASGDDEYNPYVQKLCPLNSAATLVIGSREAAINPAAADAIAHAEAIFIAGGDQANYMRFWSGTPVQTAINAAIARGVPLGGTSAGLAVMGEWAYSAEGDKRDDPNLDSKTALMNPLSPRITLAHGFLDIPILRGIITDSHFVKRNRMGRLLVFLGRLGRDGTEAYTGATEAANTRGSMRGLGIDEGAALLLEPGGRGIVAGRGNVYLIAAASTTQLEGSELNTAAGAGRPFSGGPFRVMRFAPGDQLHLVPSDVPHAGDEGKIKSGYALSVQAGTIDSTQSGNELY